MQEKVLRLDWVFVHVAQRAFYKFQLSSAQVRVHTSLIQHLECQHGVFDNDWKEPNSF